MRTFKDYANFIPEKFQACLVRDLCIDTWKIAVCAGEDNENHCVFFYAASMFTIHWMQYLPLNHITLLLVGTEKSYAELVKELDGIIDPNQK